VEIDILGKSRSVLAIDAKAKNLPFGTKNPLCRSLIGASN
jgi:hypothetical protein